jgi:hypothetical protein
MRRYVQIRDETCQGVGCNRRATLSEIDHTQAWNTGGKTHVDNLVCLCKGCHRLKHQSSFTTSQGPGGALTWTSPGGKKYTNRPDTTGESGDLARASAPPVPPPPAAAPASRPVAEDPPPF